MAIMKTTTITVDADIHQIAYFKLKKSGSTISAFCRACLERLALEGYALPNPTQIAAEELTKEIIDDLNAQKKILYADELQIAEHDQKARDRTKKITAATKTVLARYPGFGNSLPENDIHGDRGEVLDRVIQEIESRAGYTPLIDEIRAIWKEGAK